MQMAAAARLASTFPQVGEQLRQRYRVVLLDEYQDTGHAQRVALSSLFGGGRRRRARADRGRRPDPVDLRLARRVGDQPAAVHHRLSPLGRHSRADAGAAHQLAQSAAGAASGQRGVRRGPTPVGGGAGAAAPARRGAGHHPVRAAGRRRGRTRLGRRPHRRAATTRQREAGTPAPTAAVLVRRNADAAPMAEALTARGVPGGGRRAGRAARRSPEVADVVAMLRLVADPGAGAAAMRVLTGPRWRLGGRDIAALWRRAVELDGVGGPRDRASAEQIVAAGRPGRRHRLPGRRDQRSGPCRRLLGGGSSPDRRAGSRVDRAACAISTHPLPDLVAEVRRVLGVDAEVRAARPAVGGLERYRTPRRVRRRGGRLSPRGRARRSPACWPTWTPRRWWRTGWRPAEVTVAHRPRADPHRARGQGSGVAGGGGAASERPGVPVDGVDADLAHRRRPTCRRCCAATAPTLGAARRAGARHLRCQRSESSCRTRSTSTSDQLDQRRVDEERRLLYVALTRAEDTLLLSGHHWGAIESKPRGPSEFLCELKDIIDDSAAAGEPCGEVEHWAPAPADGEPNPLRDSVIEAVWPADPAGTRRGDVDRGAALVRRGDDGRRSPTPADGRRRLGRRRRRAAGRTGPRARAAARRRCPAQLSVSSLVELGRDPDAAARRLTPPAAGAPGPACPAGHRLPRLGAAVLRRRAAVRPRRPARGGRRAAGARGRREPRRTAGRVHRVAVGGAHPGRRRGALRHGRSAARWCAAASTRCSPTPTAASPSSTGRPAIRRTTEEADRHAAVQLAVYRLAWAALRGVPADSVRAAFHYVRSGQTVMPETLPGADDLAALLELPPRR